MSWDESLFKAALQTLNLMLGKRKTAAPDSPGQVTLESVLPRLKLLASALTGASIEIKEAEDLGGAIPGAIFLPRVMDLTPDPELNAAAYVYRVAFSCKVLELGVVLPEALKEGAKQEDVAEATRQALPRLRAALAEEFPSASGLLARLTQGQGADPDAQDSLERFGKLYGCLKARGAGSGAGAPAEAPRSFQLESLSSGTEKKGKPKENPAEVQLGDEHLDENPLVHSFEKVRTAEEYQGGKKAQDGTDELEEQLEALEELDLRQVIRSRERAQSVLKCDAIIEGGAPDLLADETEPLATRYSYDEWNEKGRAYRKDWCSVFESAPPARRTSQEAQALVQGILGQRHREIEDLKRRLSALLTERQWRNRQADGPEIDVDALVDRYATLASGHSPSDKFYLQRRKHHQDIAVMVLLDSSLSTDSWVENRRVLDVARESVLVLSEVLGSLDGELARLQDRVAVASFYSNTRRDCRFQTIKGFAEGWERCRIRIASVEPEGYTRIGPALRHATALLAKTRARKKLLLLVSDGKPTDYDRYEGRYGIADVRQAIREAHRQSIRVRALAVESEARFHLPQMFGEGNFQILPHPGLLAQHLARIFAEAVA